MKKNRIRFFKFSDGKQNLQFHWPYIHKDSHLSLVKLFILFITEIMYLILALQYEKAIFLDTVYLKFLSSIKF